MEKFSLIEFHQTRDFGKKINATFEFLKQNFKPLGKSILFIAGPAVLIGSIFIGSFVSDFLGMSFAAQSGDTTETLKYFGSVTFWAQMGLMYVFLIISYVITLATINSYVWLYYEKQTNQLNVPEVWEKVRETVWRYLGSILMIFLGFILFTIFATVMFIILQKISTFLLGLAIFAVFLAAIYVLVGMSMMFYIQVQEDKGFLEAAGRSLQLVRGKWWSTFGLAIVLSMIGGAISYVFIIPYYIYMGLTMMNSVTPGQALAISPVFKMVSFAFLIVYYMAQMLLHTLPSVGLVFQYFNLVEMKEAKGLMRDLENFGKAGQEPPSQDTF